MPGEGWGARHRQAVPLDRLCCGEEGIVFALRGPPPLRARLRDLGFCEGARVGMIKCAPLVDPIEFRVAGSHVGLRRAEAHHVWVRDVHHAGGGPGGGFPGHRWGPWGGWGRGGRRHGWWQWGRRP